MFSIDFCKILKGCYGMKFCVGSSFHMILVISKCKNVSRINAFKLNLSLILCFQFHTIVKKLSLRLFLYLYKVWRVYCFQIVFGVII